LSAKAHATAEAVGLSRKIHRHPSVVSAKTLHDVDDMSNFAPETFTLSGDYVRRALDALEVAKRQVHLAQSASDGWRMEEALSDVEDGVTEQISRIKTAKEAEEDDDEESGRAERIRRSERPLHPAA
jgi:hypothetical protein